jgi:hypothetical protein
MISGSRCRDHAAGAVKLIGHHQRRLIERYRIAVQIAQVFRCRFFGLDAAGRIVVAAVDAASQKRDAGAQMRDHEVKFGKFCPKRRRKPNASPRAQYRIQIPK